MDVATKRKRKRTRRCLDELRKRSRSLITQDINDVNKPGNHSKINTKASKINSITSKRLTLNPSVFSRSVKSETITRPAIAHNVDIAVIPQLITSVSKQCNFSEQQNNDTSPNYVVPMEPVSVSGASSSNRAKGTEGFYFQVESDSDGGQYASKKCAPKSFILFSPISQVLRNKAEEEEDHESSQTSSSGGDASFHEAAASCRAQVASRAASLYCELLQEMPARLQTRAPTLLAADVITKIKSHLQKLYAEVGSENEFERKEASGRSWSPLCRGRVALEPAGLSRGAPSSPPSPSPLALITDTPEYSYYPRKLNQ